MITSQEIIAQYNQGERNFSGLNLDGLSFKEQNLTGANFSGSSLKGTHFNYANLQNTQFNRVKTGIQFSHLIILITFSYILFILLGFFIFVVSISQLFLLSRTNFISKSIIISIWIVMSYLLVIFPFNWLRNRMIKLIMIPSITGLTGIIIGGLLGIVSLPFALSLALIGGISGIMIGSLMIIMTITLISILKITNLGTFISLLFLPIISGFIVANYFSFAQIPTIITSLILIFFSILLTWLSLENTHRYSFLLKPLQIITYYFGTNFYHANLANSDFSHTILKQTDFRQANLSGSRLENQ